MYDRSTFLKLGAGAAAGALLIPGASAQAQLPKPAPQGDDEGFIQFGAVGALIARDFYDAALKRKGVLRAADRRALTQLRAAERKRLLAFNAVLGSDGVTRSDFPADLPAAALRTRGTVLQFGARLHEILGGVALSGAAFSQDAATRLLLARIAGGESSSLGVVRLRQGRSPSTGLMQPLSLDVAGPALDRLLAPSDQETADQEPV